MKQIMKSASEDASTLKRNSLLILQGGGNNLHALGVDETVASLDDNSERDLKKEK